MTSIHDMINKKNALNGVLVMGIVNAAPDSFSDGNDGENPVDKALRLLDEGADIIDIGGESTRPGAEEISVETEIERVLPVLTAIKKLRPDIVASIDTRKSCCAEIMLQNGADIINDVSGLTYSENMAEVIAKYQANLIIMHSVECGKADAHYNYCNIADEVADFLKKQKKHAIDCGVNEKNILIDPGLGFSKNIDENFTILNNIANFKKIAPVLIGHSRKRFIRDFCGISNISESDGATALLSVLSVMDGCAAVRIHNVKETVRYLSLAQKIRSC